MKGLRGKPQILKKVNSSLVLETLAELGLATRVELAKKTKLSQPTVNSIVRAFEIEGLVRKKGLGISEGGRRAEIYELNPVYCLIVVMTLHTDRIEFRVINALEAIVDRGNHKIKNQELILDEINHLILKITQTNENIKIISIGVPGAVSNQGVIYSIPQIISLEGVNLQKELAEYHAIPVAVNNDLNTTALGYYTMSLQSQSDNMVYLSIGKGIGAGIVLDGKVLKGHSNFAGEVAYMYSTQDKYVAQMHTAPLEQSFFHAQTMDEKIQVIARMVINIICTLNPSFIVFSSSGVSEDELVAMKTICAQRLPAFALPNFQRIDDEQLYYMNGLLQIARNALDQDIKLIANAKKI